MDLTTPEGRRQRFRELAADLERIDVEIYAQWEKDPLEPIVGEGRKDCSVALFGRDPGRDEVRYGLPFIGAGGQKVRAILHEVIHGMTMPDFEASVAIGEALFWANTVPYKPIGNKAWSETVKKKFQPVVASVLLHAWSGTRVITLGREAFFWFAIGKNRQEKQAFKDFWQTQDRFQSFFETTLTSPDGASRHIELCPLPHPSPLNATWYKRFPDLLRARLVDLGF